MGGRSVAERQVQESVRYRAHARSALPLISVYYLADHKTAARPSVQIEIDQLRV